MPSLGRGQKRTQAKQLSKRTAPPAQISTKLTAPSSGTSTASATPRTGIFHSSLRPSKRPAIKKEIQHGGSTVVNDNVDVFAFMEQEGRVEDEEEKSAKEEEGEGQSSDDSSTSTSPRVIPRSPRYSDLEVGDLQDGIQRDWGVHSDSGISMRSYSPDPESPVQQKYSQQIEWKDDIHQALEHSPEHTGVNPTYWPDTYPAPRMLAQPVAAAETLEQSGNGMVNCRQSKSTSGYDLLASNISAHDDALLKPIYRKFEILNNRMLLYLQDEIAQIEEDLKEMDAAIAAQDSELGKRGPTSRRSEAKLPSQLQWHRIDLLGRSFAKVEQYNRALTSYSKLTKSLDPASHADVATYRDWISKHTPVAEQETRFLDSSDLISIQPSPSAEKSYSTSEEVSTSSSDQHIININSQTTKFVLAAFAMILVVFKCVPHILARLGVGIVIGLVGLVGLHPEILTDPTRIKMSKHVVAVYCVALSVLSLVVG